MDAKQTWIILRSTIEMATDQALLSTPTRREATSVPGTPYKRARSFPEDAIYVTPSKAPRLMQPVARSKREALRINSLISRAGHGDEESSPTDSDLSSCSDTGAISPLSDASSLPSSSPEMDYLDVFLGKSVLAKETVELNRIIAATMSHEPCHRFKVPKRPILTSKSRTLNLMVSSSRGSLEDATIYATEINAVTTSSEGSKIPILTSACERVTIPVNSSIKRKHKLLKEALFGIDYAADESESEAPDAALIEGFEFKSGYERSGTDREIKKIRWANDLIV